jgi:hypothetical protein
MAGDKSNSFPLVVAPSRLQRKRDFGRCLLGSTAIGKARFFRTYAEVLVSPLRLASLIRSSLLRMLAGRRLNGDSRKHLWTEFCERRPPEMVRTKFSTDAKFAGLWPTKDLVGAGLPAFLPESVECLRTVAVAASRNDPGKSGGRKGKRR